MVKEERDNMNKKLYLLFFMLLISISIVSALVDIGEDQTDISGVIIRRVTAILQSFFDLSDVLETTYAGSGGQCVIVNLGETGLVFGNCSNATGGGAGDITAVLGDEWITNGSVTGLVQLIFNVTLLQEKTLNKTDADLTYLNLSGTNANQDINISPFNMELNNLTVRDVITQSNYTLHPVTLNDDVIGQAFCLESPGTSGTRQCKFLVQPGGPGQSSIIRRSFAVVNDDVCLGANATNMQCYADEGNFTWSIDFNTSITGADLGIADDLEVIGDIYLRDNQGEIHFLSRDLQLSDELHQNILFNRITGSINGGILFILSDINETLVVNLNATETILTTNNDSIALNTGTNTTPAFNYVSYQNPANPSLTISNSEPTAQHADVAKIYVGDSTNQIYLFDVHVSHNDEFIDLVYDRFDDQGAVYISGLDITTTATEFNVSSGTIKIRLDKLIYTNNVSSEVDFFFINSSGNFETGRPLDGLVQYATGETISNNKYFNIVAGVVPINQTTMRMMAVFQDKPSTEYGSLADAEADIFQTTNFFPNNENLKKVFVPVARAIVKEIPGTNQFQTLSNGQFHFDIRGQVTSSAGAPSSPPIVNHDELNNLDYASTGHTGFLADDGSTPLTGNWAAGAFNITGLERLEAGMMALFNSSILSTSSMTLRSTQQYRFEPSVADTDIVMLFPSTSNIGEFDWMEDENYFKYFNNILMNLGFGILFRDPQINITSPNDGELKLSSDNLITLDTPTLDITGNITLANDKNITTNSSCIIFKSTTSTLKLC